MAEWKCKKSKCKKSLLDPGQCALVCEELRAGDEGVGLMRVWVMKTGLSRRLKNSIVKLLKAMMNHPSDPVQKDNMLQLCTDNPSLLLG
jgi:hypothetical protein|eukprot:CAMPEP_0174301018 /NCGR_PEP_ID=MMETSP0809-20121228/58801_1 /TAXON_ID=73025 ORGANISM="Eutreptiella gymnastica-like, Strain CCMP1594" /NCGR_SAMPLE_ID=MMETSP0809 /ASSEMBLY_ACC=CAM_ASM_000658 /LENGTH=88 /DNA_ID=CAMNT_0015406697 /DNA_START=1979 /DNA_END=2245 /DNA_ORIENTATION=+